MTMEIAPEDQDKLAQLFGGKLGGNAADLFAAAAKNVAGGTPPAATASMGMPGMPGMPVATRPAAAASDDPNVTAMPTSPMPGASGQPAPAPAPPLPTVPTFQTPPLATMQDLSHQIQTASQPIRRQDYQPRWWERLFSVPYAAVEGYGDEKRGVAAGRSILDRRYNIAMENQRKTVNPLEEEFKRQESIEPFMRDTNANAQHTFEDQHQNYDSYGKTQDRQEATEQRRDAASERADARQQDIDRKSDEDKTTPAPGARPELGMVNGKPGMVVRTKSGDRIPYTAKTIDEGAMLGDPNAERLFRMEHREKGTGEKTSSKTQFRMIETKKQDALDDAEDEYNKRIQELDEMRKQLSRGGDGKRKPPDDSADRQTAATSLQQKKQRIQNAYEAEIAAAGGEPAHYRYGASGEGKGPTHQMTDEVKTEPAKTATTGKSAKTTTKSMVQAYADSHKLTYDQALQGFKSKGYNVQ